MKVSFNDWVEAKTGIEDTLRRISIILEKSYFDRDIDGLTEAGIIFNKLLNQFVLDEGEE